MSAHATILSAARRLQQIAQHNATVVFLATNAKAEELRELERRLGGVTVVRYTPPRDSVFTNQARRARERRV